MLSISPFRQYSPISVIAYTSARIPQSKKHHSGARRVVYPSRAPRRKMMHPTGPRNRKSSRDECKVSPACARSDLLFSLFLFLSPSPSRVRLGLSTSSTPIEVEAYITRGARPWPPPPIYSGRSDGRTNLGTSTNPYCAARTRESRIVLGPVSLLFFFFFGVRRHWGLGRAGRQRTGGGNERDEEKQGDGRKGG